MSTLSLPNRASDAGPEPGDPLDWKEMTEEADSALRRARREPGQEERYLTEALDWVQTALATVIQARSTAVLGE